MWNLIAGDIPAYQDSDGLLRYFPGEWPGSEALTAYILSVTAEAGLPLPEAPKRQDDRRDEGSARRAPAPRGLWRCPPPADRRLLGARAAGRGDQRRCSASSASRRPRCRPSSLADYLAALGKVPGLANGAQLRADAEKTLRTRLVYEGTRIDLSTRAICPGG
jgi:hypothetical protein